MLLRSLSVNGLLKNGELVTVDGNTGRVARA
jgi:hypothetical protein